MRIFALTVGRNEAHRYLKPMLEHTHQMVDGHFFYDDRSEDNTAGFALDAGCTVVTRSEGWSSFAQNEGTFRYDAWHFFEGTMEPKFGDWVLIIDCDEALVCSLITDGWHRALRHTCEEANPHAIAVDIAFDEVFALQADGRPLVRKDRLWGTIHAPRLFRYREGGTYSLGRLGVPAVPAYVQTGRWDNTELIRIMHYGYATHEDQEVKYARYSGREGHSNQHVESIVATDKLYEPYPGPYVKAMVPQWTLSP